jgi:hypothetical protein
MTIKILYKTKMLIIIFDDDGEKDKAIDILYKSGLVEFKNIDTTSDNYE